MSRPPDWVPSENIATWIRTRFSYDPSTGNIIDKKSGVIRGIPTDSGYLNISLQDVEIGLKRNVKAHRIAWFLHYNEWPTAKLDHKNRVRTDNRIDNLRYATAHQNASNASKHRTHAGRSTTSEYKGVCATRGKWRVSIRVNYKAIHIGYVDDELEAAKAYAEASLKYHGERGHIADI